MGRPRTNETATHCVNGHAYTAENTYRYPSGKKVCKVCRANAQRKYKGLPPIEREQVGTWNRDKTHCPAGHEYTPENTYILGKDHSRSCKKCWRANRIRRVYGLSPEEFDKLWEQQKGRCAGCLKDLEVGRDCHVDHNHTTGAVRGLLCAECNFILGKAQDDPELLRRLARYVSR